MAATFTLGVSTASTTNATSYASGSFTPAAGDLLVAFVRVSGNVVIPQMTDSQNLGWDYVGTSAFDGTNANSLHFFVANTPAAASSMTGTFTCVGTTASGAVVNIIRVAGMTKFGSFAIRQVAFSSNNAAASTTAITFSNAVLSTNPVLGAIGNATNPATMTPPTLWTEFTDTGYATPTIGLETAGDASGLTLTTATWGSNSASAWGGIVVELDDSNTGWTILQSKQVNKTSGTGTTSTVTMATTTTGSMFAAVGITDTGSASSITAFSATGTANWTKQVDITDNGGADELGWYAYNTTTATTPTMTVTFAASTIGTVFINEYVYYNAGSIVALSSNPFDQSQHAISSGASTAPNSGATATLAATGDLVVGGAGTLDGVNRYQSTSSVMDAASGHQNGTTLDGGFSDGVAPSTTGVSATFNITASDAWGAFVMAFKQPSTGGPLLPSVADTTTTSETVAVRLTSPINVSETTTTSENVSLVVIDPVNAGDATTTSENVQLQIISNISAGDTATTSENVSILIPTLFINAGDATTTSEHINMSVPESVTVGDTTTTSENVTVAIVSPPIQISVSDTTTTSENVKVLLPILPVTISDTTTTSESTKLQLISPISQADTATTSENVVIRILSPVQAGDTTTTSENVSLMLQSSIKQSDTATTSETVSILIPTLFINVGDTTTTSENTSIAVQSSTATLQIMASDTAITSEHVGMLVPQLKLSVGDVAMTSESLGVLMAYLFVIVGDLATTSESQRFSIPPIFVPVITTVSSGVKNYTDTSSSKVADVSAGAIVDDVTASTKTDEVTSGQKDTNITSSGKDISL